MRRREPKPFWDRNWLLREYVERGRSGAEIAADFGCHEANVRYFLKKLGIPRRAIAEVRAVKRWGSHGSGNPMFGRSGSLNPHWKGGVTPDRQAFYASAAWKRAVAVVWKRDRARCQRCGTKSSERGSFHVHHIASFRHRHLRSEPGNLALLCRPCHRWVHSRGNAAREFLADA